MRWHTAERLTEAEVLQRNGSNEAFCDRVRTLCGGQEREEAVDVTLLPLTLQTASNFPSRNIPHTFLSCAPSVITLHAAFFNLLFLMDETDSTQARHFLQLLLACPLF